MDPTNPQKAVAANASGAAHQPIIVSANAICVPGRSIVPSAPSDGSVVDAQILELKAALSAADGRVALAEAALSAADARVALAEAKTKPEYYRYLPMLSKTPEHDYLIGSFNMTLRNRVEERDEALEDKDAALEDKEAALVAKEKVEAELEHSKTYVKHLQINLQYIRKQLFINANKISDINEKYLAKANERVLCGCIKCKYSGYSETSSHVGRCKLLKWFTDMLGDHDLTWDERETDSDASALVDGHFETEPLVLFTDSDFVIVVERKTLTWKVLGYGEGILKNELSYQKFCEFYISMQTCSNDYARPTGLSTRPYIPSDFQFEDDGDYLTFGAVQHHGAAAKTGKPNPPGAGGEGGSGAADGAPRVVRFADDANPRAGKGAAGRGSSVAMPTDSNSSKPNPPADGAPRVVRFADDANPRAGKGAAGRGYPVATPTDSNSSSGGSGGAAQGAAVVANPRAGKGAARPSHSDYYAAVGDPNPRAGKGAAVQVYISRDRTDALSKQDVFDVDTSGLDVGLDDGTSDSDWIETGKRRRPDNGDTTDDGADVGGAGGQKRKASAA